MVNKTRHKICSTLFTILGFCFIVLAMDPVWAKKAHFGFSGPINHLPLTAQKSLNDLIVKDFSYKDPDILEFTVEQKKSQLQAALESEGYYRANIDYDIQEQGKKSRVTFKVDPGQPVIIKKVAIKKSQHTKLGPYQISIKSGERLIAQNVLNEVRALADQVELENCFAEIKVTYKAIIDFDTMQAELEFAIEDQPQVVFGPISYHGSQSVEFQFVRRQIPWNDGDCFKPSKVARFEKTLRQEPLFSQAKVQYHVNEIRDGAVPLHIDVQDSLHRTIKLGVGYESDDGPGLYGGWVHQNYFGHGENLNIDFKASPITQFVKLNYVNPYFHSKKLTLIQDTGFNRTDSDQYESLSINAQSKIIHKINPYWRMQYGIGYRLSNVKDKNDEEAFGFVTLPLAATYDRRDSVLDTHNGKYLNLSVTPYWDTLSHAEYFFKIRLDAHHYFSLGKKEYTVLASRIGLGSILGSSFDNIPADLRYYAGGGKSVRGYAFQSLGEREDGEAIGGRSLFECSLELRQKINDTYGFVLFFDGGNVFRTEKLSFNERLRWAGGIGLRYYTSFGPLRLDVGLPVNKREGIDDSYQIYLSIGQSF